MVVTKLQVSILTLLTTHVHQGRNHEAAAQVSIQGTSIPLGRWFKSQLLTFLSQSLLKGQESHGGLALLPHGTPRESFSKLRTGPTPGVVSIWGVSQQMAALS